MDGHQIETQQHPHTSTYAQFVSYYPSRFRHISGLFREAGSRTVLSAWGFASQRELALRVRSLAIRSFDSLPQVPARLGYAVFSASHRVVRPDVARICLRVLVELVTEPLLFPRPRAVAVADMLSMCIMPCIRSWQYGCYLATVPPCKWAPGSAGWYDWRSLPPL